MHTHGKASLADITPNAFKTDTGSNRTESAERHPQFGLRVEWKEGDQSIIGSGFLYGSLLCMPFWQPGKGIQVYWHGCYAREWDHCMQADWCASLLQKKGADEDKVRAVWEHLCESKEARVCIGDAQSLFDDVRVEEAKIIGREPEEK